MIKKNEKWRKIRKIKQYIRQLKGRRNKKI